MPVISLPGIVKIEYIRCSQLPANVMLEAICGVKLALSAPKTAISFFGTPVLSWDGSKVNGKRQESSTLEFTSVDALPEAEPLAFVITTVAGRQVLIGSREPRYPVITYSETTGSPGKDSAVRSYKITHIAQKSVLDCIL
jgi:hypothetical protein